MPEPFDAAQGPVQSADVCRVDPSTFATSRSCGTSAALVHQLARQLGCHATHAGDAAESCATQSAEVEASASSCALRTDGALAAGLRARAGRCRLPSR